MAHLGHEIGRGTIRAILLGAGLATAPERLKGKTWKEFLKTHWSVLSAADFFEVEVLALGGLQRYWVLVIRAGEIQCRKRLGGLLKHYYRKAA